MKKKCDQRPMYIGELPPPMGGVTVKNELLINSVFSELNPEIINIYTYTRAVWKLPLLFLKLLKANKNEQIIYIGSGSLKRFELLLWLINFIGGEKFLSRVNTFVMGGMFTEYLKEHKKCLKYTKKTGNIFYELHRMEKESVQLGIKNNVYFPNCRDGSFKRIPHDMHSDKPIRLLHFSTVNREKGVPELLKMSKILDREGILFNLDIFGEIAKDYEDEFRREIQEAPNTHYLGVKRCSDKELYNLISSYDVFLLATHWRGESCVGVLVESKVSGIPAIVTDWKYNSEVVRNGEEGIVVEFGSVDEVGERFANAVIELYCNVDRYRKLSNGASASVERYDFNVYLPKIKKIVEDQLYGVVE